MYNYDGTEVPSESGSVRNSLNEQQIATGIINPDIVNITPFSQAPKNSLKRLEEEEEDGE